MKTHIKIALSAIIFLIIAGAGAAIYLFNEQHKDLQKTRPDFIMTASDLQKAFENNEAAATSKYVSKIIEVSGIIESINPGEDKTLSITLKTQSDLSSVICTFQSAANLSELKEGNNIVIRGENSGYLTDVLLNNCSVIGEK
jgi:hypothetical protein